MVLNKIIVVILSERNVLLNLHCLKRTVCMVTLNFIVLAILNNEKKPNKTRYYRLLNTICEFLKQKFRKS